MVQNWAHGRDWGKLRFPEAYAARSGLKRGPESGVHDRGQRLPLNSDSQGAQLPVIARAPRTWALRRVWCTT